MEPSKWVTSNEAPTLRAEGIRVTVGKLEVLCDVGLEIAKGQVLGVLGPSGAGKTTLFRALVGEVMPRAGRVLLGGVDVTQMPLWRRARHGLGYSPQSSSVLLDLTVADNLRTFLRAAGLQPQPVADLAARVELDTRLGVRARDLSGGERRRLELLRALLPDPLVLVCDEPFAAGDPVHVRLLAALLRGHADRGRSVLLADHRVGDALAICDEAMLLADGQVLVRTPAAEFASHPAVRGRYLSG
jgi:lipopolysaccharide export system ATP-binding protein